MIRSDLDEELENEETVISYDGQDADIGFDEMLARLSQIM